MDANTVRQQFQVEPYSAGHTIFKFSLSARDLELGVVRVQDYAYVESGTGKPQYCAVDWSYSRYRCSGVRDLRLDHSPKEIVGKQGCHIQMFWQRDRRKFFVDFSAGFGFECDSIEVLDASHEELGLKPKLDPRKQPHRADEVPPLI